MLHLLPHPPAPRDAVWSPNAPPGGAHGPPGLPVHGQPRRATRPGPRGHGARPQASSAPARAEPATGPGPACAHRPRAEPQVSAPPHPRRGRACRGGQAEASGTRWVSDGYGKPRKDVSSDQVIVAWILAGEGLGGTGLVLLCAHSGDRLR